MAGRLVELVDRFLAQRRSLTRAAWSGPDLTMPQAKTLGLLGQGSKRMSDIAEHLGRGMPSVTSLIDRLVKKGLVERIEDESDRRVVACQLTSEGRTSVDEFLRLGHLKSEAIADALTEEELAVVVPAMEVLAAALERRNKESPSLTLPQRGRELATSPAGESLSPFPPRGKVRMGASWQVLAKALGQRNSETPSLTLPQWGIELAPSPIG